MIEAKHLEMLVKGKDMIDTVGVDKSKAGAVGETQAVKGKFSEEGFCRRFNANIYAQNLHATTFESVHESNRLVMTTAGCKQGVGFVKHIVRGVLAQSIPEYSGIDGFSRTIKSIFRRGESGEGGAGIKEHLHERSNPYR